MAPKAGSPAVVPKAGLPVAVQKQESYGMAQKLDKVEMQIARLEATIKMYEFQMNQSDNQTDPDKMLELTELYEETQKQLDEAYDKWEALDE